MRTPGNGSFVIKGGGEASYLHSYNFLEPPAHTKVSTTPVKFHRLCTMVNTQDAYISLFHCL
jgi:hypothetical protein